MEEILHIFPSLSEKILKGLDFQSLTNFTLASRETCNSLKNGAVLWKQTILRNITGKNYTVVPK